MSDIRSKIMSFVKFDKAQKIKVSSKEISPGKNVFLSKKQINELNLLLAKRNIVYRPPSKKREMYLHETFRYNFKDHSDYSLIFITESKNIHEDLSGKMVLQKFIYKTMGFKDVKHITPEDFLNSISEDKDVSSMIKSNLDNFLSEDYFDLVEEFYI